MFNGKPDLKGRLGANAMHAQCRKQTDHPLRCAQSYFCERAVFADGKTWDAIDPSGDSFEFSRCDQSAEQNAGYFSLCKIPSAQQRPYPGEFQDCLLVCRIGLQIHDASMLQYIGNSQ